MKFLQCRISFRLLPLLIAGTFFSTSSIIAQNEEKSMTKMEQVMATHDEVMSEMPRLSKLVNKLRTKANDTSDKQNIKMLSMP